MNIKDGLNEAGVQIMSPARVARGTQGYCSKSQWFPKQSEIVTEPNGGADYKGTVDRMEFVVSTPAGSFP